MKRMNLKKAISLMAFLLVMLLGVQSASAQVVEGEGAIGMTHAKLHSLKSQQVGALSPDFSSEGSQEQRIEISYLEVVAQKLKEGSSTMNAINSTYSQFAVNATGARLSTLSAIKTRVITALSFSGNFVN